MSERAPPSVPPRVKKHLNRLYRKLHALHGGNQSSDAVMPEIIREMDAIKRELSKLEAKGSDPPGGWTWKDVRKFIGALLARELIEKLIRGLRDTCNCIPPFTERRIDRCSPSVRPSSAYVALVV